MNTTTGHKPISGKIILLISVAIQAAGLLVFSTVDALRTSRFAAPSSDVRQLDQAAEERLRTMRQQMQERRERTRLDPELAEKKRADTERKTSAVLRERVHEMKKIRDTLVEAEKIQRKKIKERTNDDLGQHLYLQVQPLASQLVVHARAQQEMMKIPPAPDVTAASETLLAFIESARENIIDPAAWEQLRSLHSFVQHHQHLCIMELDRQQVSYPDDVDRIRKENHAEYQVNLARDQLADVINNRNAVDASTMNHVPPPPPSTIDNQPQATSVAEWHAEATNLFVDMQNRFAIIQAVDTAIQQHLAVTSALAGVNLPPPPTRFSADQRNGPPSTIGGIKEQSAAIATAAGDVQSLWQRAMNLESSAKAITGLGGGAEDSAQPRIDSASSASAAQAAQGRQGRYADMTAFFHYGGDGEKGQQGNLAGGIDITHRSKRTGYSNGGENNDVPAAGEARLSESDVLREALPGRMFDQHSPRHGWMYIDTWYVIGPWENQGNIRFVTRHPPETLVDLDATYTGKSNQMLRWTFHQSNNIRIKPPLEMEQSTYYGYTEVYFEEESEMLVAVASDDAAQVWLNGRLIWDEHNGNSPWRLDEGFRKVIFRRGFNTILMRIENGPITCTYSLLLCPPEALTMSGLTDPPVR